MNWRERFDASATTSVASSSCTSVVSSACPSRASSPAPRQPFRFFDLPAELRLKIYEEVLLVDRPLDLDPMNCRLIRPRLSLFLVSHRMHEEAYPVFYAQPVRLFPSPNHGRFFHTKRPLLARLPPHYRRVINTIELRLGPGWSAPPQCQQTIENPALGLADCTHLRMLKIFVELDPSDSIFTGFRGKNATEETYKYFCLDLLQGILESVPSLETVEIDAYSGVKRDAPLVLALERMVRQDGRGRLTLVWGPLRGWENAAGQSSEMGQDRALAGLAMRGGTHAMATYIEVQA